MGTVAYESPVFAGMAPDGWADEGWVRLIQGGVNYILEDWPVLLSLFFVFRTRTWYAYRVETGLFVYHVLCTILVRYL